MAKEKQQNKEKPEVKKAGRPTDYDDKTADIICERISDGESLRKICLDEEMPCRATVFRWLSLNKVFSDQYARARDEQAELMADDIVSISDEITTTIKMPKNGGDSEKVEIVFDATAVARNKLRIDARKWVAAKLKPKKYGDRVQQEITGVDGGPIDHSIKVSFVAP